MCVASEWRWQYGDAYMRSREVLHNSRKANILDIMRRSAVEFDDHTHISYIFFHSISIDRWAVLSERLSEAIYSVAPIEMHISATV